MITLLEASGELLTELGLDVPSLDLAPSFDESTVSAAVVDAVLGDTIAARHARDHQCIDVVYDPSRDTVATLVELADEAGWVTTGPELAPLCEATGCGGCAEHWRTTVYGSTALLGHDEVRADLAAAYTACGLTLTH